MEKQELRTFGRRHGKKLSARQTMLIDRVLPTISPTNLPANTGKILEIGFGAGEHLREIARQNPDKTVIGAEPFMNGVASLLSAITNESNIVRDEYKNIPPVKCRFLKNINKIPGPKWRNNYWHRSLGIF